MKIGVYPGSFDPFTVGHLDVLKSAVGLFDLVYVAVLNNSAKSPVFGVKERIDMIERVIASEGFENVRAGSFDGLLVDYAQKVDAHYIIRGLRAITDFEYDYHVSYTLQNLSADYTAEDVESLRRRLNRIGNMVNVEGEEAPWKIHVHTNNPGGALSFGVELGEVTEIEVLNMPADRRAKNPPPEPEAPPEEALPAERKPSGMVAVSLGDGFSHIFRDLGVDVIVEGGQTMNPSIDDILQAINRCNADTVYVFPNNGNVVMAANQAAEIAECSVFVIPTKNVAMGIAAAVAYQPDSDSEANVRAMTEAAENVKTATVTFAVRDSENNGVTIHEGDYIGLQNGQIACAGNDLEEVIGTTMNAVMTEDDELITVYYGSDVSEADAKKTADHIADSYPDCDVECLAGGQPLYYYLISVE